MNTTAPELKLSSGAVSNAILNEAGRHLQEEINNYRWNCKLGDVLKTKGHGLKARYVYHVLCAYKTQGAMVAEKVSNKLQV